MTLVAILITALGGIVGNKLRAALTMLGIVIGVASVILMLALGNGARAAVEANFRYLGSDIVQISVKEKLDQGDLVPVGNTLSYQDGLALASEVELVDGVSMTIGGEGKVRHGRSVLDLAVTGATAEALKDLAARAEVQPLGLSEGVPP